MTRASIIVTEKSGMPEIEPCLLINHNADASPYMPCNSFSSRKAHLS